MFKHRMLSQVDLFIKVFGLITFIDILSVVNVQAQNKCVMDLALAEKKYFDADFDSAIVLLSTCLNQGGLGIGEQTRAYKLLGLVYIAKNDLTLATENIKNLLKLAPDYQSDPSEDPPELLEIVWQLRRELEERPPKSIKLPKKGSKKKWLWIGVGTAALSGGAIAVLAGGGKDGPPPTPPIKLPDPPGSP